MRARRKRMMNMEEMGISGRGVGCPPRRAVRGG